jgi:cell division protein FtsA
MRLLLLVALILRVLIPKGVIAVGGSDREITHDDLVRVEDAAMVIQMPANREIIQIFPRKYRLDGQDDIKRST